MEEVRSAINLEDNMKVIKYMVDFDTMAELNNALNLKKALDSIMNHIWFGLIKLILFSSITLLFSELIGLDASIIKVTTFIMLVVMFIDIAFCTIYFIDHKKTMKLWKEYTNKLKKLEMKSEFIIDKNKRELTIIEKDFKHNFDRININKISNIREVIYDKSTHSLAIIAKPIETKVMKGIEIVSKYIITGNPYNIIDNYNLDDRILNDLEDIIDDNIIYRDVTNIKAGLKSEIHKRCLLEDGKCAFNLKGKCQFCNFEHNCEDKDKNRNEDCVYWRCKGRSDGTWCNIYKI